MIPLLIAVAQLPKVVVPDGWGVNVHFTDGRPGEVAKIARAFRWVRMDFAWGGIERERGKYDFAAYDRLLASLEGEGVRAYFILDYGNDLYGEGSPRTPEARAAFCRWVAAAMARYRGRGVVWEIWNEPNIGFWKPAPNVEEYIALARDVGETIRRAAPKEILVGPATSGFDWAFLQRCLDAGLLRYWDAVSVHPYRQNEPESVEADWLRLRAMIDRAAPGRNVPMVSGEWGYSELYQSQTKARQAEYAARQYLVNLSCGVPISIWYDWKDDGADPKEAEHHFGSVLSDLSPKPAYVAMARLSKELAGFTYVTRLHTYGDARQWLLLFRKGGEAKVAAWTTGAPARVALPGVAADLGAMPKVVAGPSLAPLLAAKPLPWAVTDDLRLDPEPGEKVEERRFGKAVFLTKTHVLASRPFQLRVVPERDGRVVAVLENPFGRALPNGSLIEHGTTANVPYAVEDRLGAATYPYRRALRSDTTTVAVTPERDRYVAPYSVAVPRFVPFSLAGATASADGDAKVRAAVSVRPEGGGVRLAYDFDRGWRFAEVHPADGKVEGKPSELGLWIDGNGSGDLLRLRYVDATGQTFQPDGGSLDGKGWRYVAFPFDGSGGRWGGANDGVVHWPIRITTLALVDMPGGRGGKGEIGVSRAVLAYAR